MGIELKLNAGISLCLLLATGCSKSNPLVGLSFFAKQEAAPDGVTVNFCTDPAVQQKFVVKTVVILDHSGSNKENYLMAPDGSGAPQVINGTIDISPKYATDPTGSLRYGSLSAPGTLLNYLSTTPPNDPANPTRYFALVDFNSAATTYPANSAGFTSDVPAFFNYVQQDSQGGPLLPGSPQDAGATSYLAALGAAYNIINGDVQNAVACSQLSTTTAPTSNCPQPGVQVTSEYAIIFMSDGSPITEIDGVGTDPNGNVVVVGAIKIVEEPTDQILGAVQSINALASNAKFVAGINLFTIYYYNPANNIDQGGQALLTQMAKVGNGLHYDAVSGSKLDYASFQPPTRLIKYTLADIFVTNSSVAWWGNQLLPDTDMDGLPDQIETAFGTDPNNAYTQRNGVSDLVAYQLANGAPCTNLNAKGICANTPTNYANGLCGGVSSQKVNGATVFKSSDPDGLNDCEKILLSDVGGIDNPDSNGDIIPDWLEFKNGVPFQLNAPSADSSPSTDGYTLYQKIKGTLPTNFPLNQILDPQPTNYNLTQISTSPMQDCYNLVVTNLPILGDGNTVRVDVVEKSELLQDKFLYKVGKKAFPLGSMAVQFNDWNNAAEQAAGTWSTWP